MLTEEDILKCYFVPLSVLRKTLDLVEKHMPEPDGRCKHSVYELQLQRKIGATNEREKYWRNRYQIAINRAIHSHNWNKLLYLLKKSPISEHCPRRNDEMALYIRALTILLMYHPSAKAQSLLNDYFHMVLSCRSDQDKKAIMKLLLTLPDKLYTKKPFVEEDS